MRTAANSRRAQERQHPSMMLSLQTGFRLATTHLTLAVHSDQVAEWLAEAEPNSRGACKGALSFRQRRSEGKWSSRCA